jgi:hypothetical protein
LPVSLDQCPLFQVSLPVSFHQRSLH